ncbi:MAG: flagellar hook-length control protein FliK [Janthinobacterium lividum]
MFAPPAAPRATTPVARRDQPAGQSPVALRKPTEPPVYTIATPPPPSPSSAGDGHSPASLRLDPAPPRPADFAIETPALGAVGAEVTRRGHPAGDALHVHFAVDRSGTAALIAGAGDGLAEAVAATGNRLEAVTIEVRGGTTAAESSGSDLAGGASHRGDAPQHRPPAPPLPPQATSTRVRSPAIKPVVRDRFA